MSATRSSRHLTRSQSEAGNCHSGRETCAKNICSVLCESRPAYGIRCIIDSQGIVCGSESPPPNV